MEETHRKTQGGKKLRRSPKKIFGYEWGQKPKIVYKNPKPKYPSYLKNRQKLTKQRLGHDGQLYDNTCQPHIQKTAKS